jgi:hypothetical protein
MRQRETAGQVIIVIVSALAAAAVIAGISYAAGTGRRQAAALTAAGCEPGLAPAGLQCTTAPMLSSQFKAAMTPASQQLKAEESAYAASEWHHLAAARVALRAEVTSEHALDTSLAGIKCPPAMAPMVRALIRADQARERMLAEQARSSSLTRMRSFNHRVKVAAAAVQRKMTLIRAALDAPPAG